MRQFIYSLDLGRLFVWTLRNYDQVSPLILSVDESDEISIGDMSNLVLKASKFEGEVKYLTDKADGQVSLNSFLLELLLTKLESFPSKINFRDLK